MRNTCLLSTVALTALAGSTLAVNIANTGTGIIGVHNTIDNTLGIPYERGDQGPGTTRLTNGVVGTDGSAAELMDTWNGDAVVGGGGFSYIGVTGFTILPGEAVTSVSLNLATFIDGGWFGPNGSGPGAGNPLTGAHLIVPTLQVSSDGGTTWTNVASSNNDYLDVLTGHEIANPAVTFFVYKTVTFPLDTPQEAINGIRLIGPEAGMTGLDLTGYVGATEIMVDTGPIPEPDALALLGLGGLALLRRRRK